VESEKGDFFHRCGKLAGGPLELRLINWGENINQVKKEDYGRKEVGDEPRLIHRTNTGLVPMSWPWRASAQPQRR